MNPGHNKNMEIIFPLSSISPEDKVPGSWEKEKANILRLGQGLVLTYNVLIPFNPGPRSNALLHPGNGGNGLLIIPGKPLARFINHIDGIFLDPG